LRVQKFISHGEQLTNVPKINKEKRVNSDDFAYEINGKEKEK